MSSSVPQPKKPYNANIFLNNTFIGKTASGEPHQISRPLSQKTLWELMLILNSQAITAATFQKSVLEFIKDEPTIVDSEEERLRPFTNWDIIYRFVALQPEFGYDDEKERMTWQGKIFVQVPDTSLLEYVRGFIAPAIQLPSAHIPIEDYWQWYRTEDNVYKTINTNPNDEKPDESDKNDRNERDEDASV